jgi:hypothetical protein
VYSFGVLLWQVGCVLLWQVGGLPFYAWCAWGAGGVLGELGWRLKPTP